MLSTPDTSGRLSPGPPPPSGLSGTTNDNGPESGEEYILMKVVVYDRGSQTINLKISRKNITRDVTKSVSTKLKLNRDEGKVHNLIMVLTTTDLKHCIRTLKPDESILDVFETIMKNLCEKYQIADPTKLRSSVRWFYKDTRTPPLDLGDSGITVGEYDSDDEENLSESDCFYFSKVEKKGYMLKRSNKDINVWKRWYCVLADHLWCIDFNREPYKVICVRLHSLIRTKDGHSFSDQIQNIIVNSLKGSHFFRAFNIVDQRSWIDHLQAWTSYAMDNESMSMAEVIMNDEEESKSRRYRKQMGRILDSDTVYRAVCVDRRRRASGLPSNKKSVDIEDDLASIEKFISHEEERWTQRDSVTLPMRDEPDNRPARSHTNSQSSSNNDQQKFAMTTSLHDRDTFSEIPTKEELEMNLSLPIPEPSSDSGTPVSGKPMKPSAAADSSTLTPIPQLNFARLHPLDRTVTQPAMHRLHQHEFLLSYLMGFVLDVLQYKELFRHDLFCSVQSQRDAAFHIYTKYFQKQARRAGVPLHHDKLREIADEQAEIASTRLKEAMSTQFNVTRTRDAYIASPSTLALQASSYNAEYPTATVLSPPPTVGSFNSAAMRTSTNAQRHRDQSLLVQRLRSVSTSKVSSELSESGLVTPVKVNTIFNVSDECTEDNWQLPSIQFEKMIQSLFGELIRVQIESEEDGADALDNPDASLGMSVSYNPTRTSTMLTPNDIKSLALSRKANITGSGPNSPNPTGRASPLRSVSSRNVTSNSAPAVTSGLGNFFGLFGGGNSSNSNTSTSSTKSSHQSLSAGAAGAGGGGMFLSRRFAVNAGRNAAASPSVKNGGANAAILQALEEEERVMVMSQIVATADVFDEVVEHIIKLINQ
jgi:hypothetical protein